MRCLALLAVIASLALPGCGKSNILAVKRPVIPIYICSAPRERPGEQCARRFDAAQLIGLKLRSAEKVAQAHGYNVRVVAPLPPGAALFRDAESDRLDVETSSFPSTNSIVVGSWNAASAANVLRDRPFSHDHDGA